MEHQAKAVIYARYSTDRQDDSVAAQIRACTEYAHFHGLTIIGTYADEGISGKGSKTAARAQYQKMLRDSVKGVFDTILIHKYDRIARHIGEHISLEKRLRDNNITLTATAQDFGTTNEAKFMRTIMYGLSEYYIDNLSDEVKKGHKETALKALHNGGYAPFGYDVVNQKYVINEFEASYVRKMFECALEMRGFKCLIDEMGELGIVGKRGKPIKYPQIYEILRNEKYTGTYLYSPQQESNKSAQRVKPNAIRIENAFPAIIGYDQFKEVRRIMSARMQTGKTAAHLCGGLVYCGECGAKMHGITTGHNRPIKYKYYYCSAKCGAPNPRMEAVDEVVITYLRELLSPENQEAIADALRQYNATSKFRERDFFEILDKRIADKQSQYDTLFANLSSGVLPVDVVSDMGEKMQSLKTEIAALRQATPPVDITVDEVGAWMERLRNAPDENAIRLLVSKITVKNRTDISVESTLTSILGDVGCGTRI